MVYLWGIEIEAAVKELCRNHGFGSQLYLCKSKLGRMSIPGARWLKELKNRNAKLVAIGREMLKVEAINQQSIPYYEDRY